MSSLRLIFVIHYFLLGVTFVFSQNSEDSNNDEQSDEVGTYSADSDGTSDGKSNESSSAKAPTSLRNLQVTDPNIGKEIMQDDSSKVSSGGSPKLRGTIKPTVKPKEKPFNTAQVFEGVPALLHSMSLPKPPPTDTNPDFRNKQKIKELGLSPEQIDRYNRLSGVAQEKILLKRKEVIKRLLGTKGFERSEADIFFNHDSELQDLLLSLSDNQVIF